MIKSINFKSAALAAAMSLGLATSAAAAPMISVSVIGYENDPASLAAVKLAEDAFIASLISGSYLTETFEEPAFTVAQNFNHQSMTITSALTGVQFSADVLGESDVDAACDTNGFLCKKGLAILDDDQSPYGGRFPMPNEAGNNQWLDSMDAEEFSINLSGLGYNAIGFYMTDPNDASGRFEISSTAGPSTIDFGKVFGNTALDNGAAFYITIYDFENDIDSVKIVANSQSERNDGFGVDNVTVGRVPEPGTLALLGLGLAGLGAARRFKKA